MKSGVMNSDSDNLRDLMKKILDEAGQVECPFCNWVIFTKKELENHECGKNISKHSKILATIAYREFMIDWRKRRRKQKKLFDFGEKSLWEKRKELFSVMEDRS